MLRISLLAAAMTLAIAAPAAAQDAVDDLFANPREAEERTQTPPPRPVEPAPVDDIAAVEKPAHVCAVVAGGCGRPSRWIVRSASWKPMRVRNVVMRCVIGSTSAMIRMLARPRMP